MIIQANREQLPVLAALACRLWPAHTPAEMREELTDLVERPDAVCFLAWKADEAVGFAQCQLRYDSVEGTSGSPVGYLEGIFVTEEYRRQGIGGALLHACESWAKEKGCAEFASDCELHNAQSLDFHLRTGFREANRIICFAKKL